MKLSYKFMWRTYFLLGLLTWITFMSLMVAQVINHGCHSYNTATQIFIIFDIFFTAIFFALMQEEDSDAKPIQSNKKRPKTK
jgi:hypothetical protein